MSEKAFVLPRSAPNITMRPKANMKGRQGPGQKRKPKTVEPQGKLVIFRMTNKLAPIVMRKFAYPVQINSTGAGAVTLAAVSFGDAVTALSTEWTNFSQEFQEFRPVSIRVYFCPATTNSTAVTGPYQGAMALAPWQQFRITSFTTIQQSNELVKFSTLEEKEIIIYPKMSNDKLWNAVGVAFPVDRDFGFAYLSFGATLALSSAIFSVLIEVEAQFKNPQ